MSDFTSLADIAAVYFSSWRVWSDQNGAWHHYTYSGYRAHILALLERGNKAQLIGRSSHYADIGASSRVWEAISISSFRFHIVVDYVISLYDTSSLDKGQVIFSFQSSIKYSLDWLMALGMIIVYHIAQAWGCIIELR